MLLAFLEPGFEEVRVLLFRSRFIRRRGFLEPAKLKLKILVSYVSAVSLKTFLSLDEILCVYFEFFAEFNIHD